MGDGLGEVAHLAAEAGVVFLGEQAEINGQLDQTLEHLAGVVGSAHGHQAVSESEAAEQEGAFFAGQPVDLRVLVGTD